MQGGKARRILLRLWNALHPSYGDRGLEREIDAHLALLGDEFERRGMSPAEARLAARRAFGSTAFAMDLHRDARSFVWIDDLRWDLGYAARLLRRNPLFALTAAASLAIGIGANTAIFTIANALLFRAPAGVADPGRLVDIGSTQNGRGFGTISYPTFLDIRDRTTTFQGVYACQVIPQPMSLAVGNSTGGDAAERVFGSFVSAGYFAVLGAAPAAGRLFDERAATDPVVVLSYRFWTRRFHNDPAIVGRTLTLNGAAFTVVGIGSPGFQGTGIAAGDVWLPIPTMPLMMASDATLTNRAAAWLNAGGRVKPGISVVQAAAEIATIGQALAREHPEQNQRTGLRAMGLSPVPGNNTALAAFLMLLVGVVSLVLVIACANLTGVLLARVAARRREIAVRLAMGANRARLIRQLLVETAMLFVFGGAAGLVTARGMTSLVVSQLPALPFPVEVSVALDVRAMLFTTALALAAALMSGLAPALQASKADVVPALKDDAPIPGRLRLRHAFVVAQVACSIVLVVVAGLFARALHRVGEIDPGFDSYGVEIASLDLSMAGYTDLTGPLLARTLVERVRGLADVRDATIAAVLPGGFERIGLGGVGPAELPPPDKSRLLPADWNVVEPGYFRTLRIPLVAGRDFGDADTSATQPVAIVGEGVVRRFWPNTAPRDAVGRFIRQTSFDPRTAAPSARTLRVIGVAHDPTYGTLVDSATGLYLYVPLQQQYRHGQATMIVARTKDGRRIADEIRALVASVNPHLPIVRAQTADEYTSLGLMPQRIAALVAGSLGMVGVLLAATGIFGVTSYTVAQRTREYGVRIALGATRGDIVDMVLRESMKLTCAGAIAGLVVAAGAGRLVSSLLFGVAPIDPVTFIGATLLFVATGLAACYLPARRATRIDALEALRHE